MKGLMNTLIKGKMNIYQWKNKWINQCLLRIGVRMNEWMNEWMKACNVQN